MNEHYDPSHIITTAEQLVAGLFAAERDGDVQDTPPSFEAVEDEVKALEDEANAELTRRVGEEVWASSKMHFRALAIDRLVGASAPIWRVCGCIEGTCDDPDCTKRHHSLKELLVTRRDDGSYKVLVKEEVLDIIKENQECFEMPGPPTASIALSDLAGALTSQILEGLIERLGGDGDDDDDLPPAATALPTSDIEEHHIVVMDNESEATS
jgi:hypothetical protein